MTNEKTAMERFIARQRKIYPLSEKAIKLLLADSVEVKFHKGEQIFQEDQRVDHVYFVKTGFARVYLLRNGKDFTLWFTAPGEMLAGASFSASTVNAEALENTVLLKITARHLEELFEQSLELANWGRKLAEYYLSEYEHYFVHYSNTDARTQYERLLREYPDLIQKVPLKHIASYLQITPQSLSRIRALK